MCFGQRVEHPCKSDETSRLSVASLARSEMRFAVVRVSSAYLRALYSEQCIGQRRSYSSDMECGPVLESVRERAGAGASGREHCAIVPVFYRFVMH